MKIYTKFGDKGHTALVSGEKVLKSSLRVNSYGAIDELNSSLGIVRASVTNESLKTILLNIQRQLFSVGGELASNTDKALSRIPNRITEENIKEFESIIDDFDKKLTKINDFIIPGENLISAQAHMATTICRRAERLVVTLAQENHVREEILIYLNRLSDLLFVISRSLSPNNSEFWQ